MNCGVRAGFIQIDILNGFSGTLIKYCGCIIFSVPLWNCAVMETWFMRCHIREQIMLIPRPKGKHFHPRDVPVAPKMLIAPMRTDLPCARIGSSLCRVA